MRSPLGTVGAVIALSLASASAGTAHGGVNLVFNGGFEQQFAGWSVPPNMPPGPNGALFTTPNNGTAHSGNRYAGLSSTQLLFVSQFLPDTVAGTDYELEFWVRRILNTPGRLVVRWEGQAVFDQFVLLPDDTGWHRFSIPLTSNFAGSFLEFGQMTFPNEFHIDDIGIRQVPVPATLPFIAMCGLAMARRCRHS